MGILVGFLAPGEDMNNLVDCMAVQIENLPATQKIALDQYTKLAKGNLEKSFPDSKVLTEGNMMMSKLPAHFMVL